MHDDFKTHFINILSGKISENDLVTVSKCLDVVAFDYKICKRDEHLAVVTESEDERNLKLFLATKKLEGRSPKTLALYEATIRHTLDFLQIPVKDITTNALRYYLAQKEIDGCSCSTAENYRAVLRAFFGWLSMEGIIKNNPAAGLGKIKGEETVKLPFNKTDIEKLRDSCTTVRDRALLEFLLSTGCRISEAVGANISDLNFVRREILVTGKGNKQRIAFIDDVAVLWLERYINQRNDGSPALFRSRKSDRLTVGGAQDMLKHLGELAGVENVHPHRFRRTLATTLINRGMSVQDVAAVLGHDNINTTMTYVYMDGSKVKSAYFRHTA